MIGVMDQAEGKGPLYHLAPVGLSVALFYASVLFPLVLAFAAIPLYISMVRHGRRYGVTAAIGASMTVLIISGAQWALVFTSVCVLMALTAAEAYRRRSGLGLSVAAGATLPFLAVLGMFSITAHGAGSGLFEAAQVVAQRAVDIMVEKQTAAGSGKEMVDLINDNRQTLTWVFSSVFPALVFNMTMFLSLLHYLSARSLSIKYGWSVHSTNHDLTIWRAPDKLVWLFLAGGALSLTGFETFSAGLGLNITLAMGMVYAFQGLSTAHHWLAKSATPPAATVLIYVLILVAMPWSAIMLFFLGLTDALLDLRKDADKTEAGTAGR